MAPRIVSEEELLAIKAKQEAATAEAAKASEPDDPEDDTDDFEMDFDTGLTVSDVQERTDDLEQLSADYILDLLGAEDISVDELGFGSDLLSEFLDMVEMFLAEQGVQIYRPAVIKENDGTKHIVYSKYDNDLGFG